MSADYPQCSRLLSHARRTCDLPLLLEQQLQPAIMPARYQEECNNSKLMGNEWLCGRLRTCTRLA